MEAAAASTEIRILGWSVVLLLVQIMSQAVALDLVGGIGPKYLLGPRDRGLATTNVLANRLMRALRNLLETYPAFVALALALAVTGRTGGVAAAGAVIWLIARCAHFLLYAAGVPVARTIAWLVSVAALAMMLWRLLA